MNEFEIYKRPWWHDMVMYQVYPRSFYDTDGDGIGDITGVTEKLDYIKSLGVNVIWLNPFFKSPQIDNGYDVADYHEIDPIFGDMASVEALIAEAHKRDIKICFDLVLNHTSDQHPWFKQAILSSTNKYRDYYIFKDAKTDGSAPTNWEGFFTGSAWEKEPYGNQYYLHLFAKEMPDLNWENPQVIKEMINSACFWASKGVDAFRLDAFIHVKKNQAYPDAAGLVAGEIKIAEEYFANQPEVPELIKQFTDGVRKQFPDIFFLGEGASATPELTELYSDPERTGLDAVITFRIFALDNTAKDKKLSGNMQSGKLDIAAFKKIIDQYHWELDNRGGPVLYWNNHDMARAVSRFGDDHYFRRNSAKMLAVMLYLQKSLIVIMYGEEIGMKNLQITSLAEVRSPEAKTFAKEARLLGYSDDWILESISANTKDASRGIMQWSAAEYADFSISKPWTGVNLEADYNVIAEEQDFLSVLHFYRAVIKLRENNIFKYGHNIPVETNDELFVYRRTDPLTQKEAVIICNVSSRAALYEYETGIDLDNYHPILENVGNRIQHNQVTLAPYGCVVLTNGEIEAVTPTRNNISHPTEA